MDSQSWFDCLPKLELHLHLEGAIPLEALWELIQKYGGEPDIQNLAALERRFLYRDFNHFLNIWSWKNRFLREYEDFTFVAEAVARDLFHQNIRYAEVFYSPADFSIHGLSTQRITEAIRIGLQRVSGIRVALIADLVRNYGPDVGAIILNEVIEVRDLGVVGIGLGGSEKEYPPEQFGDIYAAARHGGFHTTAHAGEAAGPESIWGVLHHLQVDRIGHGTRAEEDERLLDHLAEFRIPLEMCPLSNVCTGVVPSFEQHPVRRYFDQGLVITINTDDPLMFGNSLSEELRLLHTILDFSRDEIRELLLQTIKVSWMSEPEKEMIRKEFIKDPAWLEAGVE
ncbi:adenosine deaminase [Gemmatimonadota bacterium]